MEEFDGGQVFMNKITYSFFFIFGIINCFGFPKDCKQNDFACNPVQDSNTDDILYVLTYSEFIKFIKTAEIIKTMPTAQELVNDGIPDNLFINAEQRKAIIYSLQVYGFDSWRLLKCDGVAIMNNKIYFWKLLSRSWLRITEASDKKPSYPLEGSVFLHLRKGIANRLR
jgi:hypothetical protein